MKPHASGLNTHMDLVNFIHSIFRNRCSEYMLYDVCLSTQTLSWSQLFSRALPSNFHRCLGPSRQCVEFYPNSLWLLVRDIYNTLV